jgi:hypothetical protein
MAGRGDHVTGLEETRKAFDELPKALGFRALRQTAGEALQPMLETAKQLAPDDPNTAPPDDLRGSLEIGDRVNTGIGKNRRGRDEFGVEMYMGPTRRGYPQAIPQEFGAVQHPPHPYMRPAWQQHVEGVFRFVARRLGELVGQAAKRLERRNARLARKGK